jgi:solute carrier family 7 (cationic amino acid transporter), member 14
MMVIMAAGVKKSLIFNNILNVINLAVWVFIMTAGLFYVDSKNWSEHKGFLPYGWSGVSYICTFYSTKFTHYPYFLGYET